MKDKIGFILLSVCFALFTPYLFRNLKNLLGKNVEPAPLPSDVVDRPTDVRMFTKAELAKYDGTGDESTLLYLCVMGRIYDVSRGAAHYGPGGSYNIFIGRDASKAFITGKFDVDAADDLDDVLTLSPDELLSLHDWTSFYDKDYEYIGRLIGRFYRPDGSETEYAHKVSAKLEIAQEKLRAAEKQRQKEVEFPPCNMEWKAGQGTHVWCTKLSGGVSRDWNGFPRQYYTVGVADPRCACVATANLQSPSVTEYPDCDSNSESCTISDKE